MNRFVIGAILSSMVSVAHAQYNPQEAFPTNFFNTNGNLFRSASGKPSKMYWQNRADYAIKASFDTTSLLLKANVKIDYTNNSPDALDELWLELDQNNDKSNSRANEMTHPGMDSIANAGFKFGTVRILREGKWVPADYTIVGTRMLIRTGNQVIASGSKVQLDIDYQYILQKNGGGGRSGYMATQHGSIYEFSYWYPCMCVYDDLIGWNTLPFIGGGEMYLDYGNVDYTLTLPAGTVVVGTGKLENGKEIWTDKINQRLDQAAHSDKTVMIRASNELQESPTKTKSGNVTWHFKMENTRDVAWAFSKSYIWDAAKLNLPEGKTGLAQSVYPIESTEGESAWARSTEFLKFSVEHFSERWFPFPYPVATSVAGSVGGMEYPGLAFNDYKAGPYVTFLLASHEIGHTWFPMIVGSNERRNAWMDEGFNTFIDIYAHDAFNKGEFAPKRDGEFSPGKNSIPADEIAKVIAGLQDGPTLMTAPDAQNYKTVHPLNYFKSAFGLVLLRDVILGPERFDYAFRRYVQNWAFKHPSPEDFFHAMENGGGEDLRWFWKGWYYNNWQFDVAIEKTNGKQVTLSLKQKLPLPIPIEVKEANGKTHRFKIPVEVWSKGDTYTFDAPISSDIIQISIDPDKQLPDVDRSNNSWH